MQVYVKQVKQVELSPCKPSKMVSLPLAQQYLLCESAVVDHTPGPTATARLKLLVSTLSYSGITILIDIYS